MNMQSQYRSHIPLHKQARSASWFRCNTC